MKVIKIVCCFPLYSVAVNRVATYKQLDSDLHKHAGLFTLVCASYQLLALFQGFGCLISRSQTLAERESLVNCPYKTCSNTHPPQLGWVISSCTATAFILCCSNTDVSSKRSLTHTRQELSTKQCKLCGAQLEPRTFLFMLLFGVGRKAA